ncbi:MAG: protein translocase subunit SecF [Spirochaetaceae bacterium]|jgi:preprotein translocase subunit SecF|nr:protein translocase subunit SecF [Spirochaetaceae bacterium]
MKKMIRFSRAFVPAAILSLVVIAIGIAGYFVKGGFNLGVDFQAGFIQEVRFAPTAFTLTYSGKGDATVRFTRTGIEIVISGANVDGATYTFNYADYPTLETLTRGLSTTVDGLAVDLQAGSGLRSEYLLQSAQGDPQLNLDPFVVHYLQPDATPIPIADVRAALTEIDVASIQILGLPSDRHFLIRIDAEEPAAEAPAEAAASETAGASADGEAADGTTADGAADGEAAAALAVSPSPQTGGENAGETAADSGENAVPTPPEASEAAAGAAGAGTLDETVRLLLEKSFGEGSVAITRSDFVGSRFSKQLASQAGILLALTLLLILIYASIRFKPQFAVGAVLAIAHDALIMVAFIAWSRMEFNTTTIAAILTILGYSINDTIVVFDRVRETKLLHPEYRFSDVIDTAVTDTLSRTIITTLTTMLAVLSLYIFTTRGLYQEGITVGEKISFLVTEHNNMKDFAQALLIGMVSGVYSTIFIACGCTLFWEKNIKTKKIK